MKSKANAIIIQSLRRKGYHPVSILWRHKSGGYVRYRRPITIGVAIVRSASFAVVDDHVRLLGDSLPLQPEKRRNA